MNWFESSIPRIGQQLKFFVGLLFLLPQLLCKLQFLLFELFVQSRHFFFRRGPCLHVRLQFAGALAQPRPGRADLFRLAANSASSAPSRDASAARRPPRTTAVMQAPKSDARIMAARTIMDMG